MKDDYQVLLDEAAVKISKAMRLLAFSVKKVPNYELNKAYLPDELEPFDALSDRFIRVVETFIKFFRTYEYYQQIVASAGYRDLLNQMAKFHIINEVNLWLDMRDVRNKIVHDYLPEQTQLMYQKITGVFYQELTTTQQNINELIH